MKYLLLPLVFSAIWILNFFYYSFDLGMDIIEWIIQPLADWMINNKFDKLI